MIIQRDASLRTFTVALAWFADRDATLRGAIRLVAEFALTTVVGISINVTAHDTMFGVDLSASTIARAVTWCTHAISITDHAFQ